MDRRKFLSRSGIALSASFAIPSLSTLAKSSVSQPIPGTWEDIRSQFKLDPEKIHMSQMFIATHPKWISDAIEKYRAAFDANPFEFTEDNLFKLEVRARQSAAN
ncbi:MAG TPA: hypothetical protein PLR06_03665, partial [Cyclobacteriaceae bacterium]|nr:hypothetical protein [Cyclobacteriaceae bacterium]